MSAATGPSETLVPTGLQSAAADAQSLLESLSKDGEMQVQNAQSDQSLLYISNHLGENQKREAVEIFTSVRESSALPKTFWTFDPTEFHQAITAKIPALKHDLDVAIFVSFDLSVQTLLATIDSSNVLASSPLIS